MTNEQWSELVLVGHFAPEEAGQYHNMPFEMPARVGRIEVHYEYSAAIGSDPHLTGGNTLDIGIFDQRGADFPGAGFRGWTGSARHSFFITHADATPGYLPGPLEPGIWHITLGFYKSAPDGCDYRITIRFLRSETAVPAPIFPTMLTLHNSVSSPPARAGRWYRGELHCHSFHSDGDSDPRDIIAAAKARGLDFLAITDHNAISHLAALAQVDIRDLALIPGCEVTTYKGHWNVWGVDEWIDFRTLTPELMRQSIQRAVALGYLTSCNHPRQYGPPWDYQNVVEHHCIEVWNGPWELFNSEALAFWESRLRQGEKVVAVGGSDAHFLTHPHIAQIGRPTTWIFCPEQPIATNLLAGLRAGHAFISEAPDGPQIYLWSGSAMMGDTVSCPNSRMLEVTTRVVNGIGARLELIGAEGLLAETNIVEHDQIFCIEISQTGYVRAQLVAIEPNTIRALTNPIYIEYDENAYSQKRHATCETRRERIYSRCGVKEKRGVGVGSIRMRNVWRIL